MHWRDCRLSTKQVVGNATTDAWRMASGYFVHGTDQTRDGIVRMLPKSSCCGGLTVNENLLASETKSGWRGHGLRVEPNDAATRADGQLTRQGLVNLQQRPV